MIGKYSKTANSNKTNKVQIQTKYYELIYGSDVNEFGFL